MNPGNKMYWHRRFLSFLTCTKNMSRFYLYKILKAFSSVPGALDIFLLHQNGCHAEFLSCYAFSMFFLADRVILLQLALALRAHDHERAKTLSRRMLSLGKHCHRHISVLRGFAQLSGRHLHPKCYQIINAENVLLPPPQEGLLPGEGLVTQISFLTSLLTLTPHSSDEWSRLFDQLRKSLKPTKAKCLCFYPAYAKCLSNLPLHSLSYSFSP